MPDALHLKPIDVDAAEKRKQIKICIVGCGLQGASYVRTFAKAGFKVSCADADQSLLKKLAKGEIVGSQQEIRSYIRDGILNTTDDVKCAAAQSDVVFLTSGASTDERGNLDFTAAESYCKQIGAGLQRGTVVIFSGDATLGFTEEVVKETLERVSGFKMGIDFGVAYVHGAVEDAESEAKLTVAADDSASLNSALLILSTATKCSINQISNVKIAELKSLSTALKRNVATALMNELAVLCEKAGVDVFELLHFLDGALQEDDNYSTISDDEEKHGTELLLESAENLDVKLKLAKLSLQVNESTVRHAVNITQRVLRDCGKTLRRARIAVLSSVVQEKSEEAFVKMLVAQGARINLYSPHVIQNEGYGPLVAPKRSLVETVENSDCIVFLSKEEQFKRLNLKSLHSVMKSPAGLVDLVGLLEPEKVESEGFLYRGLGRGIERK